jgi:predicted site-specific integrase-resolvase
MNDKKFVRIHEISKFYGVCNKTVLRWCDSGKIKYSYTLGGHRIFKHPSYNASETTSCVKNNKYSIGESFKTSIVYVRVSTQKQKQNGDLGRQINFMANKFPGHRIVTDTGSGLNFKRKGLLTLLEQVKNGDIQEIVVASRDRLSRFGFDFFEWFCSSYGTKILVLDTSQGSKEQELTEDLLAILHVFSCRVNGRRRYREETDDVQKNKNTQKPAE